MMSDRGHNAVVLTRAAMGAAVAFACGGGCAQPPSSKLGILDENPAVKIPAIKRAAVDKNLAEAAPLVDQLTDEDGAIRFYAIEALKQMAGDDFGYHYYDDRAERAKAVERWRQWLLTQQPDGTPATRPAVVNGN